MAKSSHSKAGRRRATMIALVLLLLLGAGAVGIRILISDNPGRDFRERSKAAGIAMSEGRYSEARIILTRLVEEYPERLNLRQQLTFCLLKLGRPEAAAAMARGSLEIDPKFAPAHSMLSLALLARGDAEGAVREARLATKGRQVADNAHLALAELLIELGLESEGIKVLVENLESDRRDEGTALRLATLMIGQEIESGVASGKARLALKQQVARLKEKLKRDPADPEVVGAVARMALAAGDPEVASEALIAVKVHRELSDVETVLLARALAAAGHLERARALLDGLAPLVLDQTPVEELDAKQQEARALALGEYQARIVARIETGSPELALADLDRLEPQTAAALPLLKLRLVALWRLAHRNPEVVSTQILGGHGDDLEATATAILEQRPLDERSRVSRALVLLARGQADAALADAVHLERYSPGLDDGAWLHGLAALELGFARSALDLLQKARPGTVDAESARWIVKAAIFARDTETVARFLPLMKENGNGALRAMAALVDGDADLAEEIAAGQSFASSPVSERVHAAGMLSGIGRDATSQAQLSVLLSEDTEMVGILRANLLLFLGREEEAFTELREVADRNGRHALPALLALAERAASHGVSGNAEYEALLAEIRALPDGSIAALLHEGGMALTRGDSATALLKAREVLAIMPANASARALQLECLLAAEAVAEEVEAAADDVLEVAPGFAPARMVRALALVKKGRDNLLTGDPEAATDQLNEAVSLAPGVAGARLLRGMALVGGGDLRAAEEDVELLKNSKDSKFSGYFLEGLLRSSRGDHEGAVESFKAALDLQPDSVDAASGLGLALLRAGRTDEAMAVSDRLAGFDAGTVRSLKIRASAFAAKDDLDAAERSLRQAIAADEADLGARLLLSRVLVAEQRGAEAVAVLRGSVRVSPRTASTHAQLVQLLLALGRPEDALTAADAAARVPGLEALSHILRFHCLRVAGRKDESIEALEAAIRIQPENSVALQLLGEVALEKGDAAEGRRLLERAAGISPRNLRVLMRLGVLAQMAGQDAEARVWYDRLLEQNPRYSPAANNLAFLLASDPQETARAVLLAQLAVSNDPENGEYRDTLAVALSANDQHQEAMSEAEEALRLLPKNAMIAVRSARTFRAAGRLDRARELAERARTIASPAEKEEVDREVRKLLISMQGR